MLVTYHVAVTWRAQGKEFYALSNFVVESAHGRSVSRRSWKHVELTCPRRERVTTTSTINGNLCTVPWRVRCLPHCRGSDGAVRLSVRSPPRSVSARTGAGPEFGKARGTRAPVELNLFSFWTRIWDETLYLFKELMWRANVRCDFSFFFFKDNPSFPNSNEAIKTFVWLLFFCAHFWRWRKILKIWAQSCGY